PVVFNTLIELSQKYDELFIQSPYLIINNEMKKYLNDLENKDITILTNNLDYNPNYFATSGYIRYRKKIAQNTKLYEFQSQSSIHAKTIVMGDEISIIGSFNIDPRSTFLSTESVVVIYSQEFTAHLNNTLSQYLNQSLEVDDDGNYISKINVEAVNKRNGKRKIIRLLSFFTYFHDELL
ncbi:MAG TPA: phospholipase D-like domain-containing protein, partial [Bacilli bacterium]